MKGKGLIKGLGRFFAGTARSAIPLAGPIVDIAVDLIKQRASGLPPEERVVVEKFHGELQLKRDEIKADVEKKLAEVDSDFYRQAQETIRTALVSGDAYVRRMNPTIGYAWLFILFIVYGVVTPIKLLSTAGFIPPNLPWEFWALGGGLLWLRMRQRTKEKERGIAS